MHIKDKSPRPSILDTYSSRAEANTDKLRLTTLLKHLDGVANSIALDDCGAWHIQGKHGCVYTWGGESPAWVLYLACSSPKQWGTLKKRLSFLSCTQDCSEEGCFKIEGLPSPEQATLIREALGLRKKQKLSEESQEKRCLRYSKAFGLNKPKAFASDESGGLACQNG